MMIGGMWVGLVVVSGVSDKGRREDFLREVIFFLFLLSINKFNDVFVKI